MGTKRFWKLQMYRTPHRNEFSSEGIDTGPERGCCGGTERIVCHAGKKGVVELEIGWIVCSTTVSSEVCRSKLIRLKVLSPRTISAILAVGSGLISKIVCF